MRPAVTRYNGREKECGGGFLTLILFGLMMLTPAFLAAQNFDFRGVNLIDGAGVVDIHFNDLAQPSIQKLPFAYTSAVQKSLPATDGKYSVKFTTAGGGLGATLASGSATVEAGREYLSVAYGSGSSARVLSVSRDKAQIPQNGKILLRLINATTMPGSVDLHMGVTGPGPVISAIKGDSSSPFRNVDPQAAKVIITGAGNTTSLLEVTAPLGSGSPYVTLILTGSSQSNLKLYALNDYETERLPLIVLDGATSTNFRVVHVRPNAGSERADSLDVYFNRSSQTDTKASSALKYRFASRDYGPLTLDNYRVKFVPVLENPTNSLYSTTNQLNSDTSYVLLLTQFSDGRPTSIVLKRTPVVLTPPAQGKSYLRFVSANNFTGPINVIFKAGGDTFHFDEYDFMGQSQFREIPSGVPFSVEAYRVGTTTPFYTGSYSGIDGNVPAGAYLTAMSIGNNQAFSIDLLNESVSSLQQLGSFSPITSVRSDERGELLRVTAVPNPARGEFRILAGLPRGGDVEVRFFDNLGRQVAAATEEFVVEGNQSISIPDLDLPAGTYTCLLLLDGTAVGREQMVILP